MKKKTPINYFYSKNIGGKEFQLIDFEHPEIERRIISEIENGVKVTYDNRWGLTTVFAEWLSSNPELFADRICLILGCGAGVETLVLANLSKKIYINDMAPVSLALCREQLEQNGFTNFEALPGSFLDIEIPGIDYAISCFTMHNSETAKAVKSFVAKFDGEVFVINEPLKPFRSFLRTVERDYQVVASWDEGAMLQFPAKA